MFAPLPEVPETPVVMVEPPKKTLRKEKTKSKVWGLLGRSKSKKSKIPTEDEALIPIPHVNDTWNVASSKYVGLHRHPRADGFP